MLISKSELCGLIPHSGRMCLLDGVIRWDDQSILCCSDSHRDPLNPLRCDGGLAALHAFEYGAQAVAVHGCLRARAADRIARPGFLAALREGYLAVSRLDTVAAVLAVSARCLLAGERSWVYHAEIRAQQTLIAEARLTVMLGAVDAKH